MICLKRGEGVGIFAILYTRYLWTLEFRQILTILDFNIVACNRYVVPLLSCIGKIVQ